MNSAAADDKGLIRPPYCVGISPIEYQSMDSRSSLGLLALLPIQIATKPQIKIGTPRFNNSDQPPVVACCPFPPNLFSIRDLSFAFPAVTLATESLTPVADVRS